MDANSIRLIEDVVVDPGVCHCGRKDDISRFPRVGNGEGVVQYRKIVDRVGIDVDAPAMLVSVEDVIANHDVVRAGNVNSMVIRLVIETVGAAVLTRRVSADVVDHVLFDSDVVTAEEDAVSADARGGTVPSHVVDVVADDVQKCPPL